MEQWLILRNARDTIHLCTPESVITQYYRNNIEVFRVLVAFGIIVRIGFDLIWSI